MDEPWTIHNKHRYAPKREGDPWQNILDPVLKKEKIRCDGWKDEVGNLLIFAGLFSAVVTAFIVESYKTLQPDPSTDIVGLLSQISGQLNGHGIGATQLIFNSTNLPSQSFIPTHSAVRVNVFWFLSLIFSLTTVLVGIVALQWLREFQAYYPGQSAREILAIYHMRAEGMEKWHVWKIFTALPLLLQIALVLFFAGVIDFLDAIGSKAVAISATIAIAFTLLFLVLTTILPAAQVTVLNLSANLPMRFEQPPSQCSYKSSQSILFYALSKAASSFMSAPWKSLRYNQRRWIKRMLTMPFTKRTNTTYTPVRRHLSELSMTKTWIEFDLGWLWVRDACHYIFYEDSCRKINQPILGKPLEFEPKIALFDVMTILNLHQSQTMDGSRIYCSFVCGIEVDTSDLYHCVSDMSELHTIGSISALDVVYINKTNFQNYRQRNNYFRSFLPCRHLYGFNEMNWYDEVKKWQLEPVLNGMKVMHEVNLLRFAHHRLPTNTANDCFPAHVAEIGLRIQHYMFGRKVFHFSNGRPDPTDLLPWLWPYTGSANQDVDTARVFLRQNMLILNEFFRYICRREITISAGDLVHALHPSTPFDMEFWGMLLSSEITSSADHGLLGAFDSFLDALSVHLTGIRDSEMPRPNLARAMLYAAALLKPVRKKLEEKNVTNTHANALYTILVSFFRPYLEDSTETADMEICAVIAAIVGSAPRGVIECHLQYLRVQSEEEFVEDFRSQDSQASSSAQLSNPELPSHDDVRLNLSPILQSEITGSKALDPDGIPRRKIFQLESYHSSEPNTSGLGHEQDTSGAADLGDLGSSRRSRLISVHNGTAESNRKSGHSGRQGMDESQMNADADQRV